MSLNKNGQLQGGKYIIEKILGQGGFGITYLAEQTGLNRKVAIKEFFMKELCVRDATNNVICTTPGNQEIYEKCKRRFKKEAQMIASFDNPHIVRIYDVFEENETVYYVMEYITGSSLQDLIGRNGMDDATALSYIKQVGEALSYIHKKNVLHLDVKPANILVNKEGKAKLIDFGISKGYNKEGLQTTTFVAGISKGFAPLEQYSCDIEKFTPATDVYSLGATLMTLLTGQYPPEAIAIIQGGFPQCPKNVSESLWAVIKLAMSPKIENRPSDVDTFLSMLDHRENVRVTPENNETVLSAKQKKTVEKKAVIKNEKKTKTPRKINKSRIIKYTSALLLVIALVFGFYYAYHQYMLNNDAATIDEKADELYEAKQYSEAIKYFEKAAEKKDAYAMYSLGYMYYYGDGVKQDYKTAKIYLEQSSELGNIDAKLLLSECYKSGFGVKQDIEIAINLCKEASQDGNPVALLQLANTYYDCNHYVNNENIRLKNEANAFKYCKQAADQGYAEAEDRLGQFYFIGYGVEENTKMAVKWKLKAANHGYAEAQSEMGSFYESGIGVQKNIEEAKKWYRKAAAQGDYGAKNALKMLGE